MKQSSWMHLRLTISLAVFALLGTPAYAESIIISGTVAGGFSSAECITSPCPGWTSSSDGIWRYGTNAQPSYVKFAPYGGFSAWLNGDTVSIAQVQFQNARYWPSGSTPLDDPSADYGAVLSIQLLFNNPAGPGANFNWNLNLNAVRNGQDTLYQLPAIISPVRVISGGNSYAFNLLGFYQGNTKVTQLTSNQWQWTAAELRANVTPWTDPSAVPEPRLTLLLAPALAGLVWYRRRRSSAPPAAGSGR